MNKPLLGSSMWHVDEWTYVEIFKPQCTLCTQPTLTNGGSPLREMQLEYYLNFPVSWLSDQGIITFTPQGNKL